jgi:hypothetical protein
MPAMNAANTRTTLMPFLLIVVVVLVVVVLRIEAL